MKSKIIEKNNRNYKVSGQFNTKIFLFLEFLHNFMLYEMLISMKKRFIEFKINVRV